MWFFGWFRGGRQVLHGGAHRHLVRGVKTLRILQRLLREQVLQKESLNLRTVLRWNIKVGQAVGWVHILKILNIF